MTKRIKTIAILLSVILIVGLIGSIGATAAIWSNESGEAGNDTLGTAIDAYDWNVWAKYCDFEPIDGSGAMITAFNTQEAGFNSNRLIVPSQLPSGRFVVSISGQAFQTSTLKEMVEEIYIPYTVTTICANAFSGFVNLRKIVFGDVGTGGGSPCEVDMFAFAGCSGFVPGKDNIIIGNRTVNFAANAFFPSANPSLS